MHPNPVFRSNDQSGALMVALERGFGIFTVNGPDGILASHVPFVAEPTRVVAHLVRSNPIARLLKKGPVPALLIVSGPDAYISPDWYGAEDQVPTWNYVAVHLRGPLRMLPDEALYPHLAALAEQNETRLAGKKPWTMDKNRPETLAKLMRMLVPVELVIETVDSTFKLNQNKEETARMAAADEVAGSPLGHDQKTLAQMMRTWDDL